MRRLIVALALLDLWAFALDWTIKRAAGLLAARYEREIERARRWSTYEPDPSEGGG